MGNCIPNEGIEQKSARGMVSLHELSHTDRHSAHSYDGSLQVYTMPRPGYSAAGYPGYRVPGALGYSYDPRRVHRPPPGGAVLLLDPLTGVTYECDEEIFKLYVKKGRRHYRRKERGKPDHHHHHHHHDHHDDDEKDMDDTNNNNKGQKRQRATTNVKKALTPSEGLRVSTTTTSTTTAKKPAADKKRHQKTDGLTATPDVGEAMDTSSLEPPPEGPDSHAQGLPGSQMTFVLRYEPSIYRPPDVVLSSCYSRPDQQILRAIKEKAEAAGLRVWPGSSSCRFAASHRVVSTPEAIIDTKLFVCIVSELAVKCSGWEDEVALACVSGTLIFPVSVHPPQQLVPLMTTALKLQLADHNWLCLKTPETVSSSLDTLVNVLKAELAEVADLSLPLPPQQGDLSASPAAILDTSLRDAGKEGLLPGFQQEWEPNGLGPRYRKRHVTSIRVDVSDVMAEQFWADHFGRSDYVIPWDHFIGAFRKEFRGPLDRLFTANDQRQLMDMLKRKLEVDPDRRVFKSQFVGLCSRGGSPEAVWRWVQEEARQYFAAKHVFSVRSSLSTQTLHHLDKLATTKAAIGAVRDMLSDRDVHADVRAVVILALARTDASDPETLRHILRMLRETDPAVRRAAYWAVNHLKFRQALKQMMKIWQREVTSAGAEAGEATAEVLGQLCRQELQESRALMEVLKGQLPGLSHHTAAAAQQ